MTTIDLEIPPFLRRVKGEPRRGAPPATPAPMAAPPSSWTVVNQQRKVKDVGGLRRRLARKADREAAAAGKTWDTVRGGWR